MAGQSKDIGIGNAKLEGGNLVGGPLGGPGREGKRLDKPQQESGDYTFAGVPTTPLRGVPSEHTMTGVKNNSRNRVMRGGK